MVKLILVFVLVLAGCASKVRFTTIVPPEKLKVPFRRIAVLDFRGDRYGQFRSILEGELSSVDVKGKKYFTVVDRESIGKLLKEMVVQKEYGSEGEAADIGRILKVDVVVTGSVLTKDVARNSFYKTVEKCVDKKCKKRVDERIYCRRKKAVFMFTPKVIEVETARIVYSGNYRAVKEVEWCQGSGGDFPTNAELMAEAMQQAARDFVKDISPHEIVVEAAFKKYKGKYEICEKKVDAAIKFAISGDVTRALDLLYEALRLDTSSPEIYYDMALCYEVMGDYKNAKYYYRAAKMLLVEPDMDIIEALKRVERAVKARGMLN